MLAVAVDLIFEAESSSFMGEVRMSEGYWVGGVLLYINIHM